MSENQEKISGTFNGMPIRIKKVWGKNAKWEGHEFTDEEAKALFNGETIEFDAVSKAGKPYKAKGMIAKTTNKDENGNEYEYTGFTLVFDKKPEFERFEGTWNNKEVSIKRTWGNHRFTDEEVKKLLAGEMIAFEAKKKDGSGTFTAKGKIEEYEFDGKDCIGFRLAQFKQPEED